MSRYSIITRFDDKYPKGRYYILDSGDKGYSSVHDKEIFDYPFEGFQDEYPLEFRKKYEELCGRPEFIEFDHNKATGTTNQIVEMITAGDDDCAYDQPCKFGHRVEGHAVYCHNEGWLYSPRKCRRSWYTGGETRDEDCKGYQPNPNYKPK